MNDWLRRSLLPFPASSDQLWQHVRRQQLQPVDVVHVEPLRLDARATNFGEGVQTGGDLRGIANDGTALFQRVYIGVTQFGERVLLGFADDDAVHQGALE